jgi:taurine--2-oxoglutarate transaminase
MSFFTNGGAEANENAIKLARWYTGRHKIVARYRSYHGATGGAITLTGDPRRWPAEPGIPGVVRMFDPYTTAARPGIPTVPGLHGRAAPRGDPPVRGPHTVAAVILETVTGTNGSSSRPTATFQSIREVCDRHGILLIADEVMAGFGRTGKWFGVEQLGRRPGHPHVAKGINSGYVPLGAMIVREPIADWVRDKYFAGGLTYSAIRSRARPRVASIEAFQEEGIVENAAAMGDVFREELRGCRTASVDRRGARARLLLGHRARQEPRDARAARPVQRDRRGVRAGAPRRQGGARARPVPDDALERRHGLPAADDHARGARGGHLVLDEALASPTNTPLTSTSSSTAYIAGQQVPLTEAETATPRSGARCSSSPPAAASSAIPALDEPGRARARARPGHARACEAPLWPHRRSSPALEDDELAWRAYACGLLADALGEE